MRTYTLLATGVREKIPNTWLTQKAVIKSSANLDVSYHSAPADITEYTTLILGMSLGLHFPEKNPFYVKGTIGQTVEIYDNSDVLTSAPNFQFEPTGELKTSATLSGDVNVDSTSINVNAYVGKPAGGNGDFVTAYTSATEITLSALPGGVTNINNQDIEMIRQISSAGVVLNQYSRDDKTMSVVANVITVTGATFGATDTFVVYTNIAKPAGGADVDDSAFTVATDKGQVVMGVNTTDEVDAGDKGAIGMTAKRHVKTAIFNSSGDQINSFGSPQLNGTHRSPDHFTATYLSTSTLTLAGHPTITNNSQIVGIQVTTVGNVTVQYIAGADGISFGYSANVITMYRNGVAYAQFVATDLAYKVMLNLVPIGQDQTLDVTKTIEQSPVWSRYAEESIVDTTNVAATTNYYPSSTGIMFDGFKNLSFTGKMIDADGTMTLSLQAMDDEDTTSGDWQTVYFYDNINNTTVNSITVTNGTVNFACSCDTFNFKNYRYVMVNNGATNTMILKEKKSY